MMPTASNSGWRVHRRCDKNIEVEEAHIPTREEVRGFCEILGLDPLFLANEGKMAIDKPSGELVPRIC